MTIGINGGARSSAALVWALAVCFASGCGSDDSGSDSSQPGSGGASASGGTNDAGGSGGSLSGSGGTSGGNGGSAPSPGTGGAPSTTSSCFGHPEAGEDVSEYGRCLYAECCGSSFSCLDDSLCNSVYACAMNATSQAQFTGCTDRLEGISNLASKMWFLNLYSCSAAACFDPSRPAPPDPCAAYTTCSECLNGAGISSNGATGNCGWMTDGKCYSGSTRGPNDPAAWGTVNKWTFFDDAACPGGPGPNPGGCTNDVDCGSCERCERSTGKCIARLSCSN